MDFAIEISGDVVERQELLNGTQIVTLEGAGGAWDVASLVTWNIGLDVRDAEGDITLTRDDDEIFGTLTSAVAERSAVAETDEGAGERLHVEYEIDGGAGSFADATGRIAGELVVSGATFSLRVDLSLGAAGAGFA